MAGGLDCMLLWGRYVLDESLASIGRSRLNHTVSRHSDVDELTLTYESFGADALARCGQGPFQILYRTTSMDAAAKWMADHGLPPPARGIRNTGEQAMLVMPEHACGVV